LGHVDLKAEANIAFARVQLAELNFDGTQETLNQVEQLSMQTKLDPWVLGWLADCRVRLWLAAGDLNQASYWAETCGLGVNDEFSFHYDLHHINLARVLAAQIVEHTRQADPTQCLRLIDRLTTTIDAKGWMHQKIQVLVLRALVLQALNDFTGALDTIASALILAEPEGYIRTFTSEGKNLKHLIGHLSKQGSKSRYAAALYRAFPFDSSVQQPGLVEALSPREMEVLQLLLTSLSVTDIAAELVISVNTARSHIKNIYSKLGVNRRLDAIAKAKELNLVS
jgi:LuxR family maltose regulon positive regulatory protein